MNPSRALALTCALAAAAISVPLPLLGDIAEGVGLSAGVEGSVVAAIQVGYAIGLVGLVPRGDRREGRRLIPAHLVVMSLALVAMAAAPGAVTLLSAAVVMGGAAVVIQLAVAFAATLAPVGEDGRALGTATGGVVIGLVAGRALGGPAAAVVGWRGLLAAIALGGLGVAIALRRWLPVTGERVPSAASRSVVRRYRDQPLLRRRAFLAFCCFAATSAFWSTLPIELGNPPHRLPSGAVGAIALVGVGGAVAARRAGRRTDADRGDAATKVGLTLVAVAWLPIALVDRSLVALVLGAAALDAGLQMVHVANQKAIGPLEPDGRSAMTAAYMLAYSLGSAVGAVTATSVHRAGDWPAVSLFGSVVAIAGLAAWLWWAARRVRAGRTLATEACGPPW